MSKDLCILCGSESPYDFETNINMRIGYIEGAGQLCSECYNNGNDREQILIPKSFIKRYPNDFELGSKVREYYYNNYNLKTQSDDNGNKI